MDAAFLIPLTDRVAAMAAPSGMHPAVRRIADETDAWARGHGLITGDPDDSPLGRARFARLADEAFGAGFVAATRPTLTAVAGTVFLGALLALFMTRHGDRNGNGVTEKHDQRRHQFSTDGS